MRRSYRAGAAAAATATLLTGAGIALASLHEAPPTAGAVAVSSVITPAESDLETLDAELAELRSEAKDLKARIAARTKAAAAAAKERAASDEDDDTESGATGAGSQNATRAPDVDATTGASGSGEEHEDEDEDEESGEDD